MNTKSLLTGLTLLLALLVPMSLSGEDMTPPPPFLAAEVAAPPPTDKIIIQFTPAADLTAPYSPAHAERMDQLSQAAGLTLQYFREMSGDAHVLQLPQRLPLREVQQIAGRLARLPEVTHAEPDVIFQIAGAPPRPASEVQPYAVPNDPLYSDQWHYVYAPGTSEGINLPPAWDITTGSSAIVVAVLDTGILNHADLAGRTVPGYDFISDPWVANDGDGRDPDPSDPGDWVEANACGYAHSARPSSWHGTHVAGTIGAATNNSVGVAGVDWNAKILPVRVLGRCGGSLSDILDAMRWSAGLSVSGVPNNANPAHVLNMSLGSATSCSSFYQDAINDVVAAGSIVVVAAGNSNADASNFSPAGCNNVITVAATNKAGNRAGYSNYGSAVAISAPGGDGSGGVLSTFNTGATTPANDSYAYNQGTSMAAPHVAGVVSLILSQDPSLTYWQIRSILQSGARAFPAGSTCTTNLCGAGIADAYRALTTEPPSNFSYLPVVSHSEAAPPPSVNIPNGDFEQGRTIWNEYSSQGWALIAHANNLPISPRSGSWAAWLGGDNDELSVIYQQLTIPGNAPYLAYWHWIASNDLCNYDFGGVAINNAVVNEYTLCASSSTGGWAKHVVNLSGYAGQTVTLQLWAQTDELVPSSLFIDDVSFQATAAVGETLPAHSPPLEELSKRLWP